MITLRPVADESDIAVFLDVRSRVDPEHPITRANFDDERARPDRIDVLAWLDGEPVGAAWAMFPHSNNASEFMYVSVRVPAEWRRHGVGSALFAHVSSHARAFGRNRLYTVTRHDDADTLAYLGKRGYVELTRMEDVELDLTASLPPVEDPPAGIEIVPLASEYESGMWEVAKEANPDIPARADRGGDLRGVAAPGARAPRLPRAQLPCHRRRRGGRLGDARRRPA